MGRDEPAWLGQQEGGVTVEKAYRYDWDDEMIESWDKQRGRTEYRYDPVGQLVAMIPAEARSELFHHDPAGNLFEAGDGATPREYSKGNQLLRRGDTSYFWDNDGRLVEKLVKEPATGIERRWHFRWNGAGLLKDGFEPLAHQESAPDEAGQESGGWFHYVNDPNGTPERLIGVDGEVACELRRSAWGRIEAPSGAKASTSIRFQGQYEDAETGLSYNRFRYYDSETGTFISADPIGLHGGTNELRAPANMLTWIDPFGLSGKKKTPRPEPGRSGMKLADEGGVVIVSHGTNDVDRPAHAHVSSDSCFAVLRFYRARVVRAHTKAPALASLS